MHRGVADGSTRSNLIALTGEDATRGVDQDHNAIALAARGIAVGPNHHANPVTALEPQPPAGASKARVAPGVARGVTRTDGIALEDRSAASIGDGPSL